MAKSQARIEDLSDDKDVDNGAEKKTSARKRSSGGSSSAAARAEKELRERLTDCFDRIAETLADRGDEELSMIVRDDAEVMANGLVFMTRPLQVLRLPLLLAVALVEPLLAFGRIGRVLMGRFAERRAQAIAEQQWAQEQAAAEAAATA